MLEDNCNAYIIPDVTSHLVQDILTMENPMAH